MGFRWFSWLLPNALPFLTKFSWCKCFRLFAAWYSYIGIERAWLFYASHEHFSLTLFDKGSKWCERKQTLCLKVYTVQSSNYHTIGTPIFLSQKFFTPLFRNNLAPALLSFCSMCNTSLCCEGKPELFLSLHSCRSPISWGPHLFGIRYPMQWPWHALSVMAKLPPAC